MVLALIATIPHPLLMQTGHIQWQTLSTTNALRRSHKWHRQRHNMESWIANAAHTQSVSKCVFIKCWNELCAVRWRAGLHCGATGRFLGMIGRLRPVERPIWPHFYSDGSADWLPAAESHRGWSHTHARMHTRTEGVSMCEARVLVRISIYSSWMCTHMHKWRHICGQLHIVDLLLHIYFSYFPRSCISHVLLY